MYDIFVQLCEKRGVTSYKVCKDLGISQGTISNWKNRGNNISTAILKKIADYFDVSVDVFFENTQEKKSETGVFITHMDGSKEKLDIMPVVEDTYYLSEETRKYVDFLHKNPEYRVLFDAARNVKPGDLKKALEVLNIFGKEEQ